MNERRHILVIFPISLLATLLGTWGWPRAYTLMQICKRFYVAVQQPEFWRPALRREMLLRAPPATHRPLIDYVNPFYRFPVFITMCPQWPWWTFLEWLFKRRGFLSYATNDARISIGCARKMQQLCFYERTNTTGRNTVWMLYSNDSDIPAICASHWEGIYGISRAGYHVTVNDRFVWYEGSLRNGRIWSGAVVESNDGAVTPVVGYGIYKD